MIYGSVCSGIEAATAAWHPLGWKPAFFSEIEAFPRNILKHHYPDVPCHGDFTTIKEHDYEPIDLLVGGTPCQAFSVAGLRKGLADERGNLTLEFVKLADRLHPQWIVWENVPGVLSIDGGRAFGSFLGALAELGYGFAYRILDAQYFGVAQRRRRVFVVGYFGDWRPAAAVLFERESVCGDPPPSRQAGQEVTPTIRSGASNGGAGHGARSGDSKDELIVPVAPSLDCRSGRSGENSFATSGGLIPSVIGALDTQCGAGKTIHQTASNGHLIPIAGTLGARSCQSVSVQDADVGHMIASTLRGEGFDASEDGTGRQNLVPVISPALKARDYKGPSSDGDGDGAPLIPVLHGGYAIPIHDKATRHNGGGATRKGDGSANGLGIGKDGDPMPTLDTGCNHAVAFEAVTTQMRVRRLIPVECERLQGFRDNYTKINDKTADGPRYKAIGNSMARPVMGWIGQRIDMVDKLCRQK